MSRVFIIIGILFCCYPLHSQEYVPFPESDAFWRVGWGTHFCLDSNIPDAEYQYVITGDTSINNLLYTKVERSGVCDICCTPPLFQITINGYIAAIRNDVENQKVYVILADSVNEMILYDFKLVIGDTLQGFFNYELMNPICETVVVTNIDSILIGNDYRKRYEVYGMLCHSYIIEGIGSTRGLLEPMSTMEETADLRCFQQEGQTLYPDTLSPCTMSTFINEVTEYTLTLSIYPNPFTTSTTIEYELTEPSHIQLTIYNTIGGTVYKAENRLMPVGKHRSIWTPESLREGMYYAVLKSEEGVSVMKIIKQ